MIEIDHVTKVYGEDTVLKDITHTFSKGKVHGVIGNNGSGKTVLFKCICGFVKPTKGEIRVDDIRIGKDRDFPENAGIIIETPGFLPHMTGFRNLQILASLNRRIDKNEIRKALVTVGLDPSLKKPVGKYSLGMRQRLGIAQAIMEDPGLMILDEPFNGLDKNGVAHIRNIILDLKARGKTILLSSHNHEDIDLLCDTVSEMDGGLFNTVINDKGEEV